MELIYLTSFRPICTGRGGEHRAYQILHDAVQAVGEENVRVFYLGSCRGEGLSPLGSCEWRPKVHANFHDATATKVARRIRMLRLNPLKLFGSWKFSPVGLWNPDALNSYRRCIDETAAPKICLIDHPAMDDFVRVNQARGVPTVALPHNLESIDEGPYNFSRSWSVRCRIVDFGQELSVLKRCDARLCISRVETALLNALVGDSTLYPYRPVGRIRDRLVRIRNCRRELASNQGQRRPFLLMAGTASHGPTGKGMRWILEHIQKDGFPADLVVVGLGSELLSHEFRLPASVSIRGWVPEEELETLLVHTSGLLVPHFEGVGALTRLAELRTADIPAVVSEHATHAIDHLGKVWSASKCWKEWLSAACEMTRGATRFHEGLSDDDTEPTNGLILSSVLRRLSTQA